MTLAKTHNRFPRASPGVPDCTPSSPGHWKPPSEAPYSYNLFLTLNTYYFSVSHCRATEILKTTFGAVSVLTNPPIQLIHRLRSESLLSSASHSAGEGEYYHARCQTSQKMQRMITSLSAPHRMEGSSKHCIQLPLSGHKSL